jgi:hypothetical protein
MLVCVRLTLRLARVGAIVLAGATLLTSFPNASVAAGPKKRILRHLPASTAAKPKLTTPEQLPLAEPFPADAPVKSEFVVGDLRASIDLGNLAAPLSVGGTGVATVKITDPGGNKSVSLLAESETGKVESITGQGVRSAPAAGGQSAQIPLPANGPISVFIAVGLQGGDTGPDHKLRSRLRLTLLPEKGGHDEAIVSWPLADCAGDYKRQLSRIIDERRGQMTGTLDAISAPEPSWPATWLFAPLKPAAKLAACRPASRKMAAKCSLAAPAKLTVSSDSPSRDEARVLELAGAILRERGALPQFQRHTQPLRQASFTMLNSLRLYMDQDPHPALCNGVDYMLQYYQTRTGLLRSTIDETKAALDRAKAFAAVRLGDLKRLASAPGTGQQLASNDPAPAAVSAPGLADSSPAGLAGEVGRAILPAADFADLEADKDALSKLRRLKALLAGPSTATLSPDSRAVAVEALGMIEAAHYLGTAVPKYNRLDEAIYGTMSAIGSAHKDACVCGS